MRGNIISLIGSSCSCSQTEAQEYLDSEIRYLRELQEVDDLREDDMETACLNLGLDPFVTFKEGGTGLGLAITREIIQAHSGNIYAEIESDGETSFHIVLPEKFPG